MESFQELGLPEFLGQTLRQMNFVKPTPVQAQAIPPALEGKDVIASAQTGTGKTAAFGIPLLTYLDKHRDKNVLVLTPTRELAVQVLDVLRHLSGTNNLGGSVLLIGGAPMGPQLSALIRKPRLIIGTPGRVIDHLNRGSLVLDQAGFLVLDEADRMLDMGFAPQLEAIRKRLPAVRQTLLFSATFPPDIQAMGSKYLKDPVRITVGAVDQPIPKIAQKVLYTTEAKKPEELLEELQERQGTILVFARTQHRVDRIAQRLKEKSLKATRIHGGRSQSQRRQAIDQFREGKFQVLVATDIAARGLDIHHIAHVINYDLPRNPEDYIHRVGRTARAGAEGESLCLLTPEDADLWRRILKLIGANAQSIPVKTSRFGFTGPRLEAVAGKAPHPSEGAKAPREASGQHKTEAHRQGAPPSGPSQAPQHRPQGAAGHPSQHPRRENRNFQQGHGKGREGDRSQQPNRPFRAEQGRFSEGRRPQRPGGHFQKEGQGGHSGRQNFIYHGPDDRQPGQHDKAEWKPEKPNFFQRLGKKIMGGGPHRGGGRNSFRDRPDFRRDNRSGENRNGRFDNRQGSQRPFSNDQRHSSGRRPGGERSWGGAGQAGPGQGGPGQGGHRAGGQHPRPGQHRDRPSGNGGGHPSNRPGKNFRPKGPFKPHQPPSSGHPGQSGPH